MNKEIITTIFVLVIIIGFAVLLFMHFKEVYDDGYKDGQSDVLTGNIKIVLVEFADGVREWRYKHELKDLKEHKIIDNLEVKPRS